MADPDPLPAFIQATRQHIDAALERYLPTTAACPALLCDAMRYSVMAGGKRLRPLLTIAAAHAIDPDPRATMLATPAACAVEFIHTYSLIHDDLPAMDNDTLRRGRPTLHVVYGDGVAILAGDALQAEAFALLAREPAEDDPVVLRRKIRTSAALAAAAGAAGMVGGQTIDLQASGQVNSHPLRLDGSGLRAMHLQKTGALIRAAAQSGAIMAGAGDPTIDAIDRWATCIGLAFQIVDDILDVEGEAKELGKTAGKDAAAAKPTYTSVFGLEESRKMAMDCAEQAAAILDRAELTRGHLSGIAEWIIRRRN